MKFDVFTEEDEMGYVLSETERIGKSCNLSPSAAGKLRLLAEEMLGLTIRLFDNLKYEFFIENEDQRFTLNLRAETAISSSQKAKILSLSKFGRNKATKGIFGKISGVFESLILVDGEYGHIYIPEYECMGITTYFSLAVYQNEIPKTVKEEQWDGLEKSIIASLAKDLVIGLRNNKAEMIVVIEF